MEHDHVQDVKRGVPINPQPIGSINCKLCEAFPILIEGDTELVRDILIQLNIYNQYYTKLPKPNPNSNILLIPYMYIMAPNDKDIIYASNIQFHFVTSIKRSSEKILNAIMSNNSPILRLYIYNSNKAKTEDSNKMREFVISNYQRSKFDEAILNKKLLPERDSKRLLRHYWGIIAVSRITKSQLKAQNFVIIL